jgi:type VI secretion system secreted protein VgrG
MLTPRPTALGSETALVVGSTGEEIWTDKFGRIKVQFPWDRLGKKNDTSSPWIRVAQPVAGKGFGTLFLPRVGQEVVVTYLNGDPERPLVTGCVYNSSNTTPVTLPANSTQSTIKTRSSKSGTAGNELRFEDKKDSEQFFMHAQKDMKIDIENDLASTLIKGNETHTLTEGNRTVELKKGNEIHKVKGTRTLEMTGNETHTNKANFTHTVDGDYALTIKGKLTIKVTGAISISSDGTVAINSGTALTAKAGTALTNQAGTALTNKAGTALTNQAGTALTNKGLNLTNQATMQLDNKGAIINSKASAMQTVEAGALLTLKGAIAKIN